MIVLCLIACLVQRAFTAQGKVVDSFQKCKEFFYKDIEPRGMDQNAKKICQHLDDSERSFYAILYSTSYKIPLYSAYTLDPRCSIDPARAQIHQPPGQFNDTIYDNGYLNPSSFQCGDGRRATFNRYNVAPVDACFSRDHWSKWEKTLRGYLLKKLVRDGDSAKAFIVTGTVPDPTVLVPNSDNVAVPSHIWTAVCYKHDNDDTNTFSFGYIGENKPVDPNIDLMSVSDLNTKLSSLYNGLSGTEQTDRHTLIRLQRRLGVKRLLPCHTNPFNPFIIFDDACLGDRETLNKVKEEFQELIDLPVYQVVKETSGIQDTHLNNTYNNIRISEMTLKLAFDSMSTYYNVAENLKAVAGRACLITNAKPVAEARMEPDSVECHLVPEKQKTAADGSPCLKVRESDYICECQTESETKPCCSSPCLYQDEHNGYRCYSNQTLIQCSPRYSRITYKGQECLDDHPCAKYDKDYYWCKTTGDGQDYCSPPLWSSKDKYGTYCRINHACATYSSDHTWCYTDDKNNYDKCCTSEDCYLTVSDKTCRSDHRCGYHYKSYLWCYTDYEEHWEYCCTDCGK